MLFYAFGSPCFVLDSRLQLGIAGPPNGTLILDLAFMSDTHLLMVVKWR
jgi:hypothetical protein